LDFRFDQTNLKLPVELQIFIYKDCLTGKTFRTSRTLAAGTAAAKHDKIIFKCETKNQNSVNPRQRNLKFKAQNAKLWKWPAAKSFEFLTFALSFKL
jgi:hypothetical protein